MGAGIENKFRFLAPIPAKQTWPDGFGILPEFPNHDLLVYPNIEILKPCPNSNSMARN